MASLSVVLSAALTFKHPQELKISRELIDFGYCIIRTPQLTSAMQFSFPLWLAIVALVVGLLMCLTILLAPAGLPLAAAGLFMLLRRHHVILSGSDSKSYAILAPSEAFAIQIVDRLRAVALHPTDTPSYVINIKAEKIEARTLVDLSETSITDSHGAAIVKGDSAGSLSTSARVAQTPSRVSASIAEPASLSASLAQAQSATPAPSHAIHGSHGAALNTGIVNGTLSTHAQVASAEISQGVEALVTIIERNNVAHKEQLTQMLRYIQHQSSAGPAGKHKAKETWMSFAQYAASYLSGVEGVIGLVERMQRLFR
jgi:hypothetical protein